MGHRSTPEIQQELSRLPDYIWVSEITLPHLYTGNKHKLGDVVIRTDVDITEKRATDDITDTEFIRLPGLTYLGSNKSLSLRYPNESHVPLIRAEETIPMLEW